MSEYTIIGVKENNWAVTTSSWKVDLIFLGQVIAVFRFHETAFQVLPVTCIVLLKLKGKIEYSRVDTLIMIIYNADKNAVTCFRNHEL